MFIINPYRFVSSAAFIGILDTYTGSVGAYSLRLLTGAFSGQCPIRVLRGGSSIEVDVHFDYTPIVPVISLNSAIVPAVGTTLASNLGEFIGASGYANPDGISPSNASVSIFRDQISFRHFTQTTPTNQPIIAQSGVLVTNTSGTNTHVSMLFDRLSSDHMIYSGSLYDFTDVSTFAVYKATQTVAYSGYYIAFIEQANSTTQRRQAAAQTLTQVSVLKVYTGYTNVNGSGSFANTNEVCTLNRWGFESPTGRTYVYANPTATTATVNSGTVYQSNQVSPVLLPNEIILGAQKVNSATPTSFFEGYFNELIVFNGVDSANMIASPTLKRNPITANIVNYY